MQTAYYVSVFTGSMSDEYRHKALLGWLEFEKDLGNNDFNFDVVQGQYYGQNELSIKLHGKAAKRLAKGIAKQYEQESYLEVLPNGDGWLHFKDGSEEYIGEQVQVLESYVNDLHSWTLENGQFFTFLKPGVPVSKTSDR